MSQGSASDFDLMNALDWNNGIATLPGSQIRFRLSEFGTLEIITDCDKTLDSASNIQDTQKSVQRPTCAVPEQALKKSEEKPDNMEKKETIDDGEKKVCTSLEAQSVTPTPTTAGPVPSTENERPQRLRKKRKLLMDSGDEEDIFEDDEEKFRGYQKRGKTAKQVKAAQKKKLWNWVSYLEEEKMPAAPLKLFKEVQGYRIRLHFDGYPDCYDFWVNADSLDIHPVGWCEKTGHKFMPPKGYKDGEFSWPTYLKQCKAQAAPKTFFKSYNTPVTPSGFRVGMKLEAVDRKNPSLLCVATIFDIVENRLLIHFDNWDHSYDYWCDASSPYIRPVGHCQESSISLTTPPDYKDPKTFSWEAYLEKTGTQAAPARAFKVRPPHGFLPLMKFEAVDKRNPMLIRVCTVVEREENRIKLHFDGWSSVYDYWVDADSPDIHPVGWCAKTGHPLQLPPGVADASPIPGQGCPIAGCKGIGHVRGPKYGTHYTAVGCPYSEVNLNREGLLQDRLSGERPLPYLSTLKARRPGTPNIVNDPPLDSPQSRKCPTLTDEQWGQGNLWDMAEWLDEEADTKPPIKKGAHTYIRLQLFKQETDGTDTELSLEQALHQSVFMTSLSSDPGHRIHLCWEKQCHLLPEVSAYTAKTVSKWNAEEVASFVQQLPGCKEQASVFREEQIDGEAFLLLTRKDLVKILGLKLGPALKIYNSILVFHNLDEN
ncbi:lethal(3)malignant brain tumor-like protein 3 isoform 2-T2 [Anomaloglossus baeobatrachus]|uniref:lethal(3)malignant brain tumor-like protein 3 isoform X2 n=1 Tax=Anomaloglossus baeobatrachus TaxID=238106 RepID=UPI003F508D34